jgi:NDP-sugar pyrophosphorylase family protein
MKLDKTDSEILFDTLVKNVTWPDFKSRSYKKSGYNFRYYHPDGWGKIVQFQKSDLGDRNNISFTINVGLYLAEAEQFHCSRQSGQKFKEVSCMVRKRIGELNGTGRSWFDINENTHHEALFAMIKHEFHAIVLPYLDTVTSRNSILAFFLNGYQSEYVVAQIRTLYHNGYEEAARDCLEKQKQSRITKILRSDLQAAEQLHWPQNVP